MKFSLLTAFAAGAALAQVGATPIRIMAVGSEAMSTNIRYGHALGNNPPTKMTITLIRPEAMEYKAKGGCRGYRMRQKAIEISNVFRKAVGLPLIENPSSEHIASFDHKAPKDEGLIRIMPFIRPPTIFMEDKPAETAEAPNPYLAHPHPHHGKHHGKHMSFKHRLANAPFVERLSVAIMALGPWEGRAVAFVLGCGLGVLLRMIWVLAIVMYRVIKGPREDENTYTQIFLVEDYPESAPVAAAPPTYSDTYADEKSDKDKDIQQN